MGNSIENTQREETLHILESRENNQRTEKHKNRRRDEENEVKNIRKRGEIYKRNAKTARKGTNTETHREMATKAGRRNRYGRRDLTTIGT